MEEEKKSKLFQLDNLKRKYLNRTKGLWKKLKNFAMKKSNFEFSKKKFPQLFKKLKYFPLEKYLSII